MKKASEFRDMSVEELDSTYQDLSKELFQLKNQLMHDKKLDKPHTLKQAKKEIARLLTVRNEKQRVQQGS